jgi:hypothetical protein
MARSGRDRASGCPQDPSAFPTCGRMTASGCHVQVELDEVAAELNAPE